MRAHSFVDGRCLWCAVRASALSYYDEPLCVERFTDVPVPEACDGGADPTMNHEEHRWPCGDASALQARRARTGGTVLEPAARDRAEDGAWRFAPDVPSGQPGVAAMSANAYQRLRRLAYMEGWRDSLAAQECS